jgi:hypothetical protein
MGSSVLVASNTEPGDGPPTALDEKQHSRCAWKAKAREQQLALGGDWFGAAEGARIRAVDGR